MKTRNLLWGLVALILILAACTSPKFEDLTTVEAETDSSLGAEVRDPDSVTIYRNVDDFRNINVMCINGDAIITRSNGAGDYLPVHVPAGGHNLCDG